MDEPAFTALPTASAPPFDGPGADALEAEVADVERALERLADGTYGTCEVCGAGLSPALLAERPAARLCPAHLPVAPT